MFLRITTLLALGVASLLAAENNLKWTALPDLPGGLGVAGPFVGVHNDALIIGGGANFPDGVPWRPTAGGGVSAKVYHDTIHVVTRDGDGYSIAEAKAKLPRTLGYGISVPTADGVLCIGGEWREGGVTHRSAKVFALGQADGQVVIDENYPALPKGTTAAAGALVGETVYVAGGDSGDGATKNFWALDLAKRGAADFGWVTLPPWDGPARTHLLASAQHDGATDCLYIFSGRMKDGDGHWRMLGDAHKFNPKSGEWKKIHDILPSGDGQPRCVMAGSAIASGKYSILVFGGDRADVFLRILRLEAQLKTHQTAGNTDEALKMYFEIAEDGDKAVRMVEAAAQERRGYDLVLMDVQMPQCDGYEATRRIRAAGFGAASLPIVALTANAYEDDVREATEAGMQAHLAKPLAFGDLVAALHRWLPRGNGDNQAGADARPEAPARAEQASSDDYPADLQQRWQERRAEALAAVARILEKDGPNPDELEEIGGLMHMLAGTAAMFDEAALGEAARALENSLRSNPDPLALRETAQRLLRAA